VQFTVHLAIAVYNLWNWDCPGKRADCQHSVYD